MPQLPLKLPWETAQTRWSSIINPVLTSPANQSIILQDLKLTTGTNIISHRLGRKLAGWNPTRVRAAATFYDNQDSNSTPELTLILVSSANVSIDLEVF